MKANIAFGIAAAMLGGAVALVQIGVASMISAKADESWERVTKIPDGASTLSD